MNFEHTPEDDGTRPALFQDQTLVTSRTGTSTPSSIEPDRTRLAYSDEGTIEDEEEREPGSELDSYIADEQEEEIDETSSTEEYLATPRRTARRKPSLLPLATTVRSDHAPPLWAKAPTFDSLRTPDFSTYITSDLPTSVESIEARSYPKPPGVTLTQYSHLDFLQNVALTVSDDHTEDGLLAGRLLLAAQDKAADNTLHPRSDNVLGLETISFHEPVDYQSGGLDFLDDVTDLNTPGVSAPQKGDTFNQSTRASGVLPPNALYKRTRVLDKPSPQHFAYPEEAYVEYSPKVQYLWENPRAEPTALEAEIASESIMQAFGTSRPQPKDPRRIRRTRDKIGPDLDPTTSNNIIRNLRDDAESSFDVSASTETKGSEAPTPSQLENHQALVTDLKKLQEHIVHLQAQARHLENVQQKQEPFKVQVLYRIRHGSRLSAPYLDQPRCDSAEGTWGTLYSQYPIKNLELYLERHKQISLIVYRDFVDSDKKDVEDPETAESEILPPRLKHYREVLRPVSSDMFHTLRTILLSKPEYAEILKGFTATNEVSSPFLFFFHSLKHLKDIENKMNDPVRRQLKLLANYVLGIYGAEYKTADAMISQGRFTADFLCYFFKPNDTIVFQDRDSIKGYVCDSWLGQTRIQKSSKQSQISLKGKNIASGGTSGSVEENAKSNTWDISVWSWSYDGHFYREKTKLQFEVLQGKREEQFINNISVYPLKFAEPALREQLRTRGETFWKCRFCRPMSYHEDTSSDRFSTHGERYMVDMKTYQTIHASNIALKSAMSEFKMTEEEMETNEPPDEQFKYVVPLTMKGFNLRRKKWLDLKVDQISDVQWNKTAFKSLVVESRTKDLIQALVSKQLSIERSTDLIEDKGNGLLLLLHGGPGTGKTLTAESVAEIAEKPLYRVTCGDIGIKAEDVEKYLESVLHLGKIWDCVVLLDEADVFLEQRTLEDLARNALVSVFLRVLEYYDGILVFTSNRVGTFDEAFKSRIQLALHYADLEEYQRQQIWNNFINRLEGLEEDVDLSDLRDNVQRLAKDEMNGRQIRNAITTARQFAEWKGEKLTYKHLEYVIEVSGRFDKYLDKLNGGMTQNELAREDRIR
ncbi:uncharacterized protein A1O9_12030 [Exophiala aquamarina CBS 119918]|uniref:AAA+ ATPase domain-containing protein n=1 Tax=Exophiala aquamarina CBS 119918 TaxID=1182545 RepID=A0A072P8X0_9EURO|nr:uncharacterized protein A1O9_12030 [Exophiala aquamarina CBS 119918]KEF52040.1 hypothetical protein A1O9_12030 [Exophiala aquamarina CBS 119918]